MAIRKCITGFKIKISWRLDHRREKNVLGVRLGGGINLKQLVSGMG